MRGRQRREPLPAHKKGQVTLCTYENALHGLSFLHRQSLSCARGGVIRMGDGGVVAGLAGERRSPSHGFTVTASCAHPSVRTGAPLHKGVLQHWRDVGDAVPPRKEGGAARMSYFTVCFHCLRAVR